MAGSLQSIKNNNSKYAMQWDRLYSHHSQCNL